MQQACRRSYNPRPLHLVVFEVGHVLLSCSVVLHVLLQLRVPRLLGAEFLGRLRQFLLDAALRLAGSFEMLMVTVQLWVDLPQYTSRVGIKLTPPATNIHTADNCIEQATTTTPKTFLLPF